MEMKTEKQQNVQSEDKAWYMYSSRNFQEGKIQSKSAVKMKAAKIWSPNVEVSISFEAQKSTFS